MKGVICTVATFKMSGPPARTGDAEKDLDSLYAYVDELYSQTKYVMSAIDEDNMSDAMLEKLQKGD